MDKNKKIDNIKFIVSECATDEEAKKVYSGLRKFNEIHFKNVKTFPLNIYLFDNGEIIGGIISEVFGNWLEVNYLWLNESYRGMGLGTKLLLKLETIAKQHGCKKVSLKTFNFQAPNFYLKKGYSIIYCLDNYPIEEKMYFLSKEI